MSANQETMRATIKSADQTKISSIATVLNSHQSTIAASGVQAGYHLGFPTGFSTFDTAVKAANAKKLDDLFAIEAARQAAIFLAKDLLRSQGEVPF